LLRGERAEVEESDQAFLGEDEVGNVNDKTLLEEEVQEVVGTGLSAPLEDTQAEAETFAEIKDVGHMDDSPLFDEESKEIMAILAVNSTDTEGSNQTLLNPSNIKDIGKETLLYEESNDVISGLRGTTLQNAQTETKTLP